MYHSPGHGNYPVLRSGPRTWLQRTRSRLLRMLGLVGLVGLGLTTATPTAVAQAPAPVPQHWISYAQLVSNQFQAWLSDPANDTVVRLHTWMQDRLLKEGQPVPPPPLIARVWIAADGTVQRLDFASLGNDQADADLRALLVGQTLSEPPPIDMRQPMVLQLDLSFVSPV
jgi:hypothetical protein